LVTCDWIAVVRAAASVPVTDTGVQPEALTVNVAAPVPELLAATVTGCGRFQSLEFSVIVLPEVMPSPVLPDSVTVTLIAADGSSFSDTPNSSLVPCDTVKLAGLAFRTTPDPQLPVGVVVGDGDGDGDGDVVGLGEGDGDGDDELVGLGDGEAPVVVPVQVTVAGAVFVPL